MEWESFEKKLGTWSEEFKPFFLKGGFEPIYDFLKSRRPLGYRVIPDSENTFRVFEEVRMDNLKCIIWLQNPYPWVMPNKEGRKVAVANGIAMDCRNIDKCQPSILNFYEGISSDLFGKKQVEYKKDPSLKYLTDQGIMLINSDLTTELNIKDGHEGKWREFMKFFIEEIINLKYVGLPIILAGKKSQALAKYIDPLRHKLMHCEHPASAAYSGGKWNTEDSLSKKNKEAVAGVIKKADYYLKAQGYNINWLQENTTL